MKKRASAGTFLKVPIDEKFHTYARVLSSPVFAFYDFKTDSDDQELEVIEKSKILFKLCIYRSAIKRGGWKIVGHKELTPEMLTPVPFFIREIGAPDICWIDRNGTRVRANVDECIGLERLAVWDNNHVEDRLRDYYNGVPNKWADSIALNVIF